MGIHVRATGGSGEPGRQHAVVVGGGIIGLACAHTLLSRGCRVTLIDRAAPAAGCSWGNAGWIVPSFSMPVAAPGQPARAIRSLLMSDSPLRIELSTFGRLLPWLWQLWRHCNPDDYHNGTRALVRLNARTMQCFDELAVQGVQFEEHRRGALFLCLGRRELQDMHRKLAQLAEWGGTRLELLSSAAAREMEPVVGSAVCGALYLPGERHVRPDTLAAGLLTCIRAAGGIVRSNLNVLGWKTSNGRISAAQTSAGEITGDQFVIAAGVDSRALAQSLMGNLPMHAGRGYSITYTDSACLRHALDLVEAGVVCSPFREGWRIAGLMDLSTANAKISRRSVAARIASLKRAAQRYLSVDAGACGAGVEWHGQRPLTSDGLPVIGRIPGIANGYLATGHGMLGVTLAPITAELLTECILTGHSSAAVTPFVPERFAA